jgi:hypothetical protein
LLLPLPLSLSFLFLRLFLPLLLRHVYGYFDFYL